MTAKIRTLYDCSFARYPVPPDIFIRCEKGHRLGSGYVSKEQADRGDRLLFRVCQLCVDYSPFDTPYIKE